jgi:hypothetical protein
MYMTLNFGTCNNLPRCSGVVPRCKSARRDLSVCLVGGQICMGWDGLDIVDGMIHVRVGSMDLRNGMECAYTLYIY